MKEIILIIVMFAPTLFAQAKVVSPANFEVNCANQYSEFEFSILSNSEASVVYLPNSQNVGDQLLAVSDMGITSVKISSDYGDYEIILRGGDLQKAITESVTVKNGQVNGFAKFNKKGISFPISCEGYFSY